MKGPTIYGAAIAAGVHPTTPIIPATPIIPTTPIYSNSMASSVSPQVKNASSFALSATDFLSFMENDEDENNGIDGEVILPQPPQVKSIKAKSGQPKKQKKFFRFWKVKNVFLCYHLSHLISLIF